MLVRLATAWIDPAGVVHGAGEHIDVDAVTLAELEEQGVVETMTEPDKEIFTEPGDGERNGPDSVDPQTVEDDDDRNGPDDETTGGGN
jgi:hypothetical protein